MRLEYLQYLIMIDKYHSISAAAKFLFISQSTLSSIVKSIEQELGLTIFERTPGGVLTTPDGVELLSLAWDISSKFEEVTKLKEQDQKVFQPVVVITSPSISCGFTSPISRLMLEAEPFANLVFEDLSGEKIGNKIIKNVASIGLTYYQQESMQEYQATAGKYNIQVKKMFNDHLYLLARADHPLAKRKIVDVSEIAGENMAMLSHFRSNMNNCLVPLDLQNKNRTTTFSSVPLIKTAIMRYNMLSILSGYTIYYGLDFAKYNLKAVLISTPTGENKMNLCLIHHGNRSLGYLEKVMINQIEDYFSALMPPPFSPQAKRLKNL